MDYINMYFISFEYLVHMEITLKSLQNSKFKIQYQNTNIGIHSNYSLQRYNNSQENTKMEKIRRC